MQQPGPHQDHPLVGTEAVEGLEFVEEAGGELEYEIEILDEIAAGGCSPQLEAERVQRLPVAREPRERDLRLALCARREDRLDELRADRVLVGGAGQDELATVIRMLHGKLGLDEGGVQ